MKKKVILTAIIVVIMGYAYFVKIEKYMAQKNFQKYIAEQQIPDDNIESQGIYRDYTQGGYYIDVRYKDDPKYTYRYIYQRRRKQPHHILLMVYTEKNVSVSVAGIIPKYPRLKDEA